jgi:hypothetical protein
MPVINSREFKKIHGVPMDKGLSIPEIAKLSGMPVAALREVESRGRGAYANNLQSVRTIGTFKKGENRPASQKLSIDQWSLARIYSFVMKRKGTFGGADKDIAVKYNLT